MIEYSVRFTAPVPVPDDDRGTALQVGGTVTEVRDDGTVKVELEAHVGDTAVLGKAYAVVRLP